MNLGLKTDGYPFDVKTSMFNSCEIAWRLYKVMWDDYAVKLLRALNDQFIKGVSKLGRNVVLLV